MLRLITTGVVFSFLTGCAQLDVGEEVSTKFVSSSGCSSELNGYSLLNIPQHKETTFKSPGPAYSKSFPDGRPDVHFGKSFLSTGTIDVVVTDGYVSPRDTRNDVGIALAINCSFTVHDWVEGNAYGINFVSNPENNAGIGFLLNDYTDAKKAELQSYLSHFNLDFSQ